MGFLSKLFRQTIEQPHPVHHEDAGIIDDDDRRWFCSLTKKDIAALTKVDDVHRLAAFIKFREEEGLSEKAAARRCWKYFPYFYLDPAERGRNSLGLAGPNVKLPFLIKDKVNRLAIAGKITEDMRESQQTMNAAIRQLLQRGV